MKTSFWIVSLTPFNNKLESSIDLNILIIILSFDIISVVVLESKFFLSIPASAAEVAAVNPNGIKILLANVLIKFFINNNPVYNNGPRSLPRNPPDCIILDNWVFDSITSVDNLLAKALKTPFLVENQIHH